MTQRTEETPWWAPDTKQTHGQIIRNLRQRVFVSLALLGVVAVLVAAAFAAPVERSRQVSGGGVEAPPNLNSVVSTCGGVVTWDPATVILSVLPWRDGEGSAVVKEVFYAKGDEIPATKSIAQYMADGNMVLWYNPALEEERINAIRDVAKASQERWDIAFPVIPWPEDPSRTWPSPRRLVMTSWGVSQSCQVPSMDVFHDFYLMSDSTATSKLPSNWKSFY